LRPFSFSFAVIECFLGFSILFSFSFTKGVKSSEWLDVKVYGSAHFSRLSVCACSSISGKIFKLAFAFVTFPSTFVSISRGGLVFPMPLVHFQKLSAHNSG
jgi:hypothetical protein